MKVFVFCDLEGVSGVCRFFQTRRDGRRYEEARRLLMGDVNACIDGLAAAGVDEIIVRDGHGVPYNFVPELMDPRAKYIVGPWYGRPIGGLEPDCDALILLGHHGMAGAPNALLSHTQTPRDGRRYWYNDRETGEMGQEALVAGHFDIPLIMVSGDDATCLEARDFFGDAPVAVSVKTGFGREGGMLLAPEAAHQRIRDGAKEAVASLPECRPYKIDLPIAGRLRMDNQEFADKYDCAANRATRIDDVTFEATFESQGDVLSYLI